ncbi:maternal effect embryo arrest 9 [Hibiscus trionum]|uniref:Maternal effect embryo arrest 9 n=1 Tax=Hibiscus trionum TaxID=183268 RepID=A0A9W7JH12_HIBTR|nr:maternal effect embryo arrest 9 [Hibiscus trionum]
MEALLSQFTFLSDQALRDKNFVPSAMEDLMKLFEVESYKEWAATELEHEGQVKQAEITMQEAEDYLDSVMETAMDEFRRFEEEMEGELKDELDGLEDAAEKARKMGNLMEKGATIASKLYVEAAMSSATAAMKSAFKGLSTNKVHPS